ncbi:MAG: LytTR family DNA-binding domain-containing protein [Bacteroidota bacterium]
MTAISGKQTVLPATNRALPLPPTSAKIALPITDGLRFERIENIVYLEAAGNYTFLHFQDGDRLLVCRTLQDMQSRLSAPHRFVRIHRSYIINVDYLERYVRGKGGYVVLEGKVSLTVSNSRRQAFLDWLECYFR